METYSIHKGAIIAPRKARMTLDLIRGKSVSEAKAILTLTNSKASRLIQKVLNSAIANAVNNVGLQEKDLYIKEAYINEGRTLKRFKFASHGRVGKDFKRTSHIYVKVGDLGMIKED
jgi:large subunit ribosomal protein L22